MGAPRDVIAFGWGAVAIGGTLPNLEGTLMEGWLVLFALLGAAWLIFGDR